MTSGENVLTAGKQTKLKTMTTSKEKEKINILGYDNPVEINCVTDSYYYRCIPGKVHGFLEISYNHN